MQSGARYIQSQYEATWMRIVLRVLFYNLPFHKGFFHIFAGNLALNQPNKCMGSPDYLILCTQASDYLHR